MKKFAAFVVVVGAWPLAGTAYADTGGTNLPFRVSGSGTIVENLQFGTLSATNIGTHMGTGTASGSSFVAGFPPACGSGTTPTSSSLDLTAANGDILFTETTSQVCQSGAPASFVSTGTYTITGGTGRFADATGSGKASSTSVFPGNPTFATGTFTFTDSGTISLNRP